MLGEGICVWGGSVVLIGGGGGGQVCRKLKCVRV